MATQAEEKKILLVDDDKFLIDMYALKFSQMGWDVDTALGSMDALTKLREGLSPSVIVTDILMPAMDGFELLQTIKKEKIAQEAKIIVLSNKGEAADIDKAISLGADGYIVKASAVPSEVVEQVEKILQTSS